MLEFVNDPAFDGVPLVGDGHVLIADRSKAGRVARWVPGGDVVALAEFLGPEFPVLEGQVYQRGPLGSLTPVDLSAPFLVLVPMAGDARFIFHDTSFTSVFSQVVEVEFDVELKVEVERVPKPVKAAAKKAAAAEKAAKD